MENQTNQLADLIMAIIQEKVDERIEQKVNDLQEGMTPHPSTSTSTRQRSQT